MAMNQFLRRVALLALACTSIVHTAAFAQAAASSCPPAAALPSTEQLNAIATAARDRGFLWRIRKGGHDSWLYGTVHVARIEWSFPGPAVSAALKSTDTLALEIDLLDADMQHRVVTGMKTPRAAALPKALQDRIRRQAEAECMPYEALAPISPDMQIAALSGLVGRRDGLDPAYGIDLVLAGQAHAAGKPVVSLETPELQLASLAPTTPAEMNEFVDSALTEMESGRAAPTLKRIAQVWADGDLAMLARFESWCECVKTPADRAAMKRLIDGRNPALADTIAALHAKGNRVFAAVGSLHMVGPLGLPRLLAQRGFEVEAIAFPAR